MRELTVAALQLSFVPERDTNVDRVEAAVREAAAGGARLILPPELFESPYFPKEQSDRFFGLARPVEGHPTVERFRSVARELGVVIPVSVYELAGQARFNSVVVVDADGSVLGIYRKSHIPDGPGYSEKFYFSPGDTGFRVWETAAGRIGLAICWDQWFPEAARVLALGGAEILCYPTAIGSEPMDPTVDSSGPWTRVMQGHAVANVMPVIAANRHGREEAPLAVTFYGSSFIADHEGELVAQGPRDADAVLTATFDLDAVAENRAAWGLFRDRRPELYGPLRTLDGRN
ncbi:MAG: N-carbamoylputrescine amidase [Actinomycetota bacterium]|jgi:N-carbamoylputrescine amidase|nr:N-carbamoylputrescine amidase [Actinomycetota bacterium]